MNGLLIIDKPSGLTSHDLVLFLRRRFSIKKAGHAGTLDPMATGVLVMLIGRATKLSGLLASDDKEYTGSLRLGIRTDSHDADGKILSAVEVPAFTDAAIREAFDSFKGAISQIPPMVSALRHNGKRLYQLARKGIAVERRPRIVTVYSLEVKKIDLPDVGFSVRCSKGTYIRKLADDIGERLGCGAHLRALRRTRSGRFSIEQAVSFEELNNFERKNLESRLIRLAQESTAGQNRAYLNIL